MKLRQFLFSIMTALGFAAGIFPAAAQTNSAVTTTPVFVPNTSHANDPLPDGVIAWDGLVKTTQATNGQDYAHFTFNFTNIAQIVTTNQSIKITSLTNVTTVTNSSFWAKLWGNKITRVATVITRTNLVVVTNAITPVPVTFLSVSPSCHCTTVELPPMPWTIPPGSNSAMEFKVNLFGGQPGTLFKSIHVSTDKGYKMLMLQINILPPPPRPEMTQAQRDAGIAVAKGDRQAVFKGDCASCHANKVEGKYNRELFEAVCSVCHEAKNRATIVPDLHNLPVTTSEEFWRAWITAGKAGTLMPAFATSQGGPLNDLQIASLAAYLNVVNPPHQPAATNAPATP